ncbi:hypothetical protein L9F63_027656, partial [Diploptera punctata]
EMETPSTLGTGEVIPCPPTIEHFRQHQQKIKSSMMTGGVCDTLLQHLARQGIYMGGWPETAGVSPGSWLWRSESADIPCPRGPPPPPPAFPRRRFSVW